MEWNAYKNGVNSPGCKVTLGEAAVDLPPPARLRLIREVLRVGCTQSRRDAMAVMAALVSAAATLMSDAQRRSTVEKLMETESWWQKSAPTE